MYKSSSSSSSNKNNNNKKLKEVQVKGDRGIIGWVYLWVVLLVLLEGKWISSGVGLVNVGPEHWWHERWTWPAVSHTGPSTSQAWVTFEGAQHITAAAHMMSPVLLLILLFFVMNMRTGNILWVATTAATYSATFTHDPGWGGWPSAWTIQLSSRLTPWMLQLHFNKVNAGAYSVLKKYQSK